MQFEYFSRNGEILPIAHATMSLANIEFSYGFGVYETIRVHGGKPLFLADHLERLAHSAREIGLEHAFTSEMIGTYIDELVARNGADTCNLKILLIGAQKKEDAQLNLLCLAPLFPDKKFYRDGVLCTTHVHERAFPHAKTLNMLPSYVAFSEAKKKDAYDALFVNTRGHIVEGTRTNLLGIRGRTIVTPPESAILLGVTRKHVLEVAGQIGFDVKVKDIALDHVGDFENLFLTSTSSKIVPIRQIDDVRLNAAGPALKELMAAFDAFLDSATA